MQTPTWRERSSSLTAQTEWSRHWPGHVRIETTSCCGLRPVPELGIGHPSRGARRLLAPAHASHLFTGLGFGCRTSRQHHLGKSPVKESLQTPNKGAHDYSMGKFDVILCVCEDQMMEGNSDRNLERWPGIFGTPNPTVRVLTGCQPRFQLSLQGLHRFVHFIGMTMDSTWRYPAFSLVLWPGPVLFL